MHKTHENCISIAAVQILFKIWLLDWLIKLKCWKLRIQLLC